MYDQSVKKDRKGWNYCLRRKRVGNKDSDYPDYATSEEYRPEEMYIFDEQKQIRTMQFGDDDDDFESHYYEINFCPLCGRKLWPQIKDLLDIRKVDKVENIWTLKK